MVNSKGYSAVHYAAYHGNKQNLELVSFTAPQYHCIITSVFGCFTSLDIDWCVLLSASGDVL